MSEFITKRMREQANTAMTHKAPDETVPEALTQAREVFSLDGLGNLVKGSIAGTAGQFMDFAQNLEPIGETEQEAMGLMRRPDYASDVPPKEQPFTTTWFAERLGGDPDSLAFNIGTFLDPRNAAKKSVVGAAGWLAGQRYAARLLGRAGTNVRKALDEAHAMYTAGESAEQVWAKTNWFVDPADGRWKYQIPHWEGKIDMDYLQNAFEGLELRSVKLGDFYKLPGLYQGYPELKNIDIGWDIYHPSGNTNIRGEANFAENSIKIFARNQKEFEQTLVHEVEHFIQDIEGFPTGGQSSPQDLETLLSSRKQVARELSFNTYKMDMYKWLLDQPEEVRVDKGALSEAWLNYISAYREGQDLNEMEAGVIQNVYSDSQLYRRTGQYTRTQKEVINLGIQRSILQQREALYEDFVNKTKDLNEVDRAKLLQANFFYEYKRLVGEVNARLATSDLILARGNPNTQRLLRELSPLTRRKLMLETEGIKEEDLSLINVTSPSALTEADWYANHLAQKAHLEYLNEAIKAKLTNAKPTQ